MFDNNRTSQDVNVQSGENVTLTCRAEGDPPPRISWRREDDLPILMSDSDPPVKKGERNSVSEYNDARESTRQLTQT